MPSFNSTSAYSQAVTVVTAALQSGSLKLWGPTNGDSASEKDAKYINDLINSVAKNLQTE
jgi:hypothetical protein